MAVSAKLKAVEGDYEITLPPVASATPLPQAIPLIVLYEDADLIRGARSCGARYLPKGDLRALRRAVRGVG